MMNILRKKHTWIIFIVFAVLAIVAYIWLPENSMLCSILFGVAVSHIAIVVIGLIIMWIITQKRLKKKY